MIKNLGVLGPCEEVELRYPFLAVLCSNFLSLLRIVDQFQDDITFEKQSNVVEATEALIDIYSETRIQVSLGNSKISKENSKIS